MVLLESDGRQAHLLHESEFERTGETQTADTLAPRDASMLSKLYELETNPRAILFRRYLSNWLYYALSPLAMRIGWREFPAAPQVLSSSGHNLANVLFHLKNMDESSYRWILEQVRAHMEPGLEAINFIPSPDQTPVPMIHHRLRPRASWHGLSDGTIRFLALCLVIETAARSREVPIFSVIEEPENGLFPGILRVCLTCSKIGLRWPNSS